MEKDNKINNAHDSLFKAAFKQKKVMRTFLEHRLGEDILKKIDLDTLQLENCSFVKSDLSHIHSDIVYSATIHGKKGYLYILLEAQIEEDALMPIRLLEYDTEIARDHLAKGNKKIPPIINLVLYNGKKKYKGAKSILDAFEDKELGKLMMSFEFLVDLNREEDKTILRHGEAALAELVLKHGGKGDLGKLAKEEEKLLFSMIDQSSYSTQASLYTLSQSNMKKEEMIEKLAKFAPNKQEELMSTLDRLINEGRQEGIQRGRQEGMQRGRQEGMQRGRQEGMLKMDSFVSQLKKMGVNNDLVEKARKAAESNKVTT